MYESFYGFSEKPFNITPDPKFLYLSPQHQEAISHLLYGIQERGGFIVITGEVGTGKTILCRYMLNQLDERTEGAVILNPNLSALELLKAINEDFGIQSTAQTKKALVDELNQLLLERRRRGHNMVLVIDEAQNLTPAVLEEIRLLSNLETETEKLIQIILLGQPELRELLQLPNLRQLNQRITARYHLTPLSAKETTEYIHHRMGVAGDSEAGDFPPRTLKRIFAFSGGTPRLINVLCDRLLLAGYASNTKTITSPMVDRAIREVAGETFRRPSPFAGAGRIAAGLAAAAACVAVGWSLGGGQSGDSAGAHSAAALTVPTPPLQADPVSTPAPVAIPVPVPEPTPVAMPDAAAVEPVAAETPPAAIAPEPTPAPPAAPEPLIFAEAVPPVRAAPPPPLAPVAVLAPPRLEPQPSAAENELQVISSLFSLSENRVQTRTPAIIEETLPPEPRRSPAAVARAGAARPTTAPLHLDGAADVAKLVSALEPFDSRMGAAQGLFSLWGRDFHPPKEANDPGFSDFYKLALNHGMRCSELWANFETLRQINLPVILEVFSPSAPASRYIVLAAVHDDDTGTILWGQTASARVSLQALDECWRRRVFVFWDDREPVGEIIREGDSGDPVRWVQESLATLGYYRGAATGVYEPATRRAVMAFQEEFRLMPDGIVGPRTRMVLYSRLAHYPTPNLAPPGRGVS